MKRSWMLLALLLAAPLGAQQGPPRPPLDRRAELEGQVLQRFVQRASNELRLDAAQRGRLTQIVREATVERRQLAQQHAALRRRMMQALRDPAAPDSTFVTLLGQQRALRDREHAIWDREQARLGELLTPRQLAQFSLAWMRLQDEIRGVMMQRGMAPPPGGPPA